MMTAIEILQKYNLVGPGHKELIITIGGSGQEININKVIEEAQKDACMSGFKNTTERFNMESIQGEEITNEEIWGLLSL